MPGLVERMVLESLLHGEGGKAAFRSRNRVGAWRGKFLFFILSLGWGWTSFTAAAAEDVFLQHLQFLASDELGGRGNGDPGLTVAGDYIARQFERVGLLPAGDEGSYFQTFQVTTGLKMGPDTSLAFYALAFQPEQLVQGVDYVPLSFGGSAFATGPLAFVGFGISAPEYRYDDYEHIDVAGKIVVMWEHEPQENSETSPFAGRDLTPHSAVLTKVLTAKHRGAVGVVLLPDFFNHRLGTGSFERFRDQEIQDLGIQAVLLSEAWGRRLMQLGGLNPIEVRRWSEVHLTPMSFDFVGLNAAMVLDVVRQRTSLRNVVGVLPGRSGRTILIGAHYDHLGLGGKSSLASEQLGEIHNGADDNASGTAGMLQLAEVLAAGRSRHNLLFIAFSGEELGLLGSRFYVENPGLPVESSVAMLNLDMIGRSRGELMVGGVGTASQFRPILEEIDRASPLTLNLAETAHGPSDHLAFALKKIPVLFFFSGLHSDYHRPTDDWEKVDLVRTRQVLDVVQEVVQRLDQLDEELLYVDLGVDLPGVPRVAHSEDRPYFGSIPDLGHEALGLRFAQIQEESPAEKAGLAAGDILFEFDGKRIDTLYDFTFVLGGLQPGDKVEAVVRRNGRKIAVEVVLEKWPWD